MFIYLIVNHVTGKYYVGQHKGRNLQRYLGQKLSGARAGLYPNTYLFRSMRKHHKEAWSIHALLSDIQTKQELDQYECDFIAFLRARDPDFGYNICRGGEGFTGPHSAEARRKNSEASRRMWQQPGHRKLFSSIMTGHPTSKETIDKIRAARLLQDESERLLGWAKNRGNAGHLSRDAHVLGGRAGSREAKRRAGRLGAERGMVKAQHVRWHVNRGIVQSSCSLCQT